MGVMCGNAKGNLKSTWLITVECRRRTEPWNGGYVICSTRNLDIILTSQYTGVKKFESGIVCYIA